MAALERRPEGASEIPKLYFLDTGLPVKHPTWTELKEELRTEENLFTTIPGQRSGPVDIYSTRQKIKPREYWRSVRERAYPEGLATAFAIDVGSTFILPLAQPLITGAINAGVDIMDPRLAIAVIGGTIGGLTSASIWVDRYTLGKKRFGATTIGTLAIAASGKRTKAAIADHVINYINVGILNLVTIHTLLISHNLDTLAKGWVAVPLTLTPWYMVVNGFIAWGKIDPVANFIRNTVINPVENGVGVVRQKIKR
jgi:hypothetical protein